MGVFFLLLSLHTVASSFAETIARALLQTWAVFLIASPGLAFVRQLSQKRESTNTARSSWLARWMSRASTNPQLLVMVTAVLALLVICGFLTSGHLGKF
jgi:hypothetical protein